MHLIAWTLFEQRAIVPTLTARPVYGRGNLTGEMGQRQETFMSVYMLKEEPVFSM